MEAYRDRVTYINLFIGLSAVIVGILLTKSPLVVIGMFLFLSIITLSFIFPLLIIILLLAIRSSLDIFTEVGSEAGFMGSINIPAAISLFIIAMGGIVMLSYTIKRQSIDMDRLGGIFLIWIIGLLFWVGVGYMNFGAAGLIGIREWVRLFSLLVIYFLSIKLSGEIGYKKAVDYLLLALIIPLLTGYYQIFAGAGKMISSVHRIYGTIAHPNAFALFLVLFIGITFWKMQHSNRPRFWVFILVLEGIALINTYSMSGIAMLAIMTCVIAMKSLKGGKRFFVLFLCAVFVLGFFLSGFGSKRLSELSSTQTVSGVAITGKSTNSLDWRFLHWQHLLREWRKSPVLGYGLHTADAFISPWKAAPHNDYLRFLVETGLLGLPVFLLLLIVIGKTLLRRYKENETVDPPLAHFAFILFAVYCAWLIGSFFDNFITTTVFQYYFWACLGLVSGVTMSERADADV